MEADDELSKNAREFAGASQHFFDALVSKISRPGKEIDLADILKRLADLEAAVETFERQPAEKEPDPPVKEEPASVNSNESDLPDVAPEPPHEAVPETEKPGQSADVSRSDSQVESVSELPLSEKIQGKEPIVGQSLLEEMARRLDALCSEKRPTGSSDEELGEINRKMERFQSEIERLEEALLSSPSTPPPEKPDLLRGSSAGRRLNESLHGVVSRLEVVEATVASLDRPSAPPQLQQQTSATLGASAVEQVHDLVEEGLEKFDTVLESEHKAMVKMINALRVDLQKNIDGVQAHQEKDRALLIDLKRKLPAVLNTRGEVIKEEKKNLTTAVGQVDILREALGDRLDILHKEFDSIKSEIGSRMGTLTSLADDLQRKAAQAQNREKSLAELEKRLKRAERALVERERVLVEREEKREEALSLQVKTTIEGVLSSLGVSRGLADQSYVDESSSRLQRQLHGVLDDMEEIRQLLRVSKRRENASISRKDVESMFDKMQDSIHVNIPTKEDLGLSISMIRDALKDKVGKSDMNSALKQLHAEVVKKGELPSSGKLSEIVQSLENKADRAELRNLLGQLREVYAENLGQPGATKLPLRCLACDQPVIHSPLALDTAPLSPVGFPKGKRQSAPIRGVPSSHYSSLLDLSAQQQSQLQQIRSGGCRKRPTTAHPVLSSSPYAPVTSFYGARSTASGPRGVPHQRGSKAKSSVYLPSKGYPLDREPSITNRPRSGRRRAADPPKPEMLRGWSDGVTNSRSAPLLPVPSEH